jgi:hypothetical protein
LRQAGLLPVPYFHIVFTLPSAVGDIAYQNKAVIYDLLFKAAAETMLTIAADRLDTPQHGGTLVVIGMTWSRGACSSRMRLQSHRNLVFGGSSTRTMMQSCESSEAAGPFFPSAFEPSNIRRMPATSNRHRRHVTRVGSPKF